MIDHKAQRLLDRVHEVRFFRGQLYNTAADEFLAELIEFLTDSLETEIKTERLRGLLLRTSVYLSAEQQTDRPQSKALLADIEAALGRR